MHEYRLSESRILPNKKNGSMRLDDWVLCRIYKKKSTGRILEPKMEDLSAQTSSAEHEANDIQSMKFPRTFSISNLWDLEYLGSISQLLSDNSNYDNQNSMSSSGGVQFPSRNVQLGEMLNPNTMLSSQFL
ncbi:hypothetical protein LguiA_000393 [Lonicera macranthoides]